MVGRQIKFTGATRNDGPAAQSHQKIVVVQALADAAADLVEQLKVLVQLGNHTVQCFFRNGGVAAIAVVELFLAFQIFENIRLQLRAGSHLDDFKQRGQRKVVIHRFRSGHQLAHAVEKLLQSQVSANAFIKRVFVQDHEASFSAAIIARS